ncbi:MAG: hypothetical protein ABIP97_12145, partial [Chthoniobacterales bacterium]
MLKNRKNLHPSVARKLTQVDRRWKRLYFVRLLCVLVMLVCAGTVAIGAVMASGRISQTWIAVAIFLFFGAVSALAFLIILVVALVKTKPDSWLAGEMEQSVPALMDRVHTLIYLQQQKHDHNTNAYFFGIGEQAGKELQKPVKIRSTSLLSTISLSILALAVCFGTYEFYKYYHPWDNLHPAQKVVETTGDKMDLPDTGASEVRKSWGEIRITEPGADLKLTKVDVLSLTVEAASSQRINKAGWNTAINGGKPVVQPLPAPEEPNFAVYHPSLFLDELGLKDWDVLSYYANASSENNAYYASEIYFVEVRPFREDIVKLEGKGKGKSGECLHKLTAMIHKQQDILRQTHRQSQKPAITETQQKEDQHKLSFAQDDLRKSAGHLYAEIAEAMEKEDIGNILDQLSLAEESMAKAGTRLDLPDNPAAETEEQSALQYLVASRKDLVKKISEGGSSGGGSEPQENTPVAGMKPGLEDQLSDIAAYRDEQKAAAAAVQQTSIAQKKIANEVAASKDAAAVAKLALAQKELNRKLKDFMEKTPAPFSNLGKTPEAAKQSMTLAEASMAKGKSEASRATDKALQSLNALEKDLSGQLSRRALTDVYRLKSLMDSQAQQLNQMAEQPQPAPQQDVAGAAAQAKMTKDALTESLEKTP